MEMTPQEQNYYMQQQSQQQSQPSQMFNQGQPYPHVNQQMQRSQYPQYPQMRMGYGMGGGYPRPHFQNDVNRNMIPPSEQNVSMNNNMYSMNPSLRRANNQMYMNNSAPQNGPMNNMGPWEQALNEPYSQYNHYPGTPNPQLHNQNMPMPQNNMVRNPNSQITNTPMSHNPTTAMPHQQNSSMPMQNQFSSMENPMSNYQTPASSSLTRPNTSASVNTSFGNKSGMSHMQQMQQRLQQPSNPNTAGMPMNRQPPQYGERLMKQLVAPNTAGNDNSNFNTDDKKLMPDIKLSPSVRGLSPNNNNNNSNAFNLTKLDSIKKEDSKDVLKDNKPLTNLNAPSVTIKNEDEDERLKCDSTETIPPGLLDTEEDFDFITKSLMEKSFDPFKELNAPNPTGQDILPQIPSICKSPLPQDNVINVSGSSTIPELHNLDALSLTTSRNGQSGKKTPISSSTVTTSPNNNNNQFCSVPPGMQNIYNQLVNEKDEGRDSDTPNSSMSFSKDADSSPGSNCDTTQLSCDKLGKYPNCPTDLNGGNMPSFNFEFDTDLNIFLPNYSNKPSEHNMNFCDKLINNSANEESPENRSEPSNLTNMVPLSGSNSDINNKTKASGIRKGRNKSDSEFSGKPANTKRNKGSVKKGARKSPYDNGNKNGKKVVSSTENKNSSDDTATSSTNTTTYISSPEPDKLSLYFENRSNYRFHKYLRQLTAPNKEKTDVTETYPFKKLQNCEKVFLKQLSTPVMDSWIFDSLTPGVKSDKDIDLKYMTKRKITIYEDIPSDSIYEYIEKSPTQPFRYLCPDNDRTQEPSQRLVALLQTNK